MGFGRNLGMLSSNAVALETDSPTRRLHLLWLTMLLVLQGASPSVMVAGSKTLMSLTRMIRVAGTDELDPIKKLYHLICGGVGDLEERVAGQLLCAMSAVLTLPYNGSQSAEQQGWEERATRHGKMLEAVTERYRRLPLAPDTSPQVKERLTVHFLDSLNFI